MSIERQIVRLQVRIETIAENESVPGAAGLGLEDTLAALTVEGRHRVLMLLERIRVTSEDPEERAAAEYIRTMAESAWARFPSQPARR